MPGAGHGCQNGIIACCPYAIPGRGHDIMQGKSDFSMSDVTPADVTDGRGACPDEWYAAFTRSNAERSVAVRLNHIGIHTYLPVRTEIRQWSDRKKKIETIVIPRVVFLHTSNSRLMEVVRIPGVTSLLKAPGQSVPARIKKQEMDRFMFLLGHSESPVEISAPRVIKGERVVIVRGSLRGLEGMAAEDSGTTRRLTILIDNLCCASVSVSLTDIEPRC